MFIKMGSDNSIVKDYEEKIKDLINEYNDLSCDDRKEKFPEFINKEADIFSQIIKELNIRKNYIIQKML